MSAKNFLKELKRRNVYKVAITYAIVAWLLAQVASLACSAFEAPSWVMKILIVVLAIGFPIAIILAWAFEMSPQGIVRTTSVSEAENPYPNSKKKPLTSNLLIGFLILLVIGQFVFNKYWNNSSGVVNAKIEKSIAVLPFKNMSEHRENQHFCDGMMEGILDHLAKIESFRVVSRTSVEQFRENPPSTDQISKMLNVNYLVEGSVLRIGNQAQITVQLIYGPEDRHLWSHQMNDNLEDVFSVLSNVTQSIASELKTLIVPEVINRIETPPTSDISAFEYVLQGKAQFGKYWISTDMEDLRSTEVLFRKALKVDHHYASAYARLANVFLAEYWRYGTMDLNRIDSISILCDKAIALNPSEDFAYLIRGLYHLHVTSRANQATSDLEKVVQLNPNSAQGILELSLLKADQGDPILGLKMLKRASSIDLDQVEHQANRYRGYIFSTLGDTDKSNQFLVKAKNKNIDVSRGLITNYIINKEYEKGIHYLQRSQREDYRPSHNIHLAHLYFRKQDYQAVLDALNKIQLPKGSNLGSMMLGYALIQQGDTEEGIQILREVQQHSKENLDSEGPGFGSLYTYAALASYFGKTQTALDYLSRLPSNSWPSGTSYTIDDNHFFDNIRDNKEFQSLLSNVRAQNDKILKEIADLEALGEL